MNAKFHTRERWLKMATLIGLNALIGAILCYGLYLAIPSVPMALGQFICVIVLAIPTTIIGEISSDRMARATPVELEAVYKVNLLRTGIFWPDEDGIAEALLVLPKRYKQALQKWSGKTVPIKLFTDEKFAAFRIRLFEGTFIPAAFNHSSLRTTRYFNFTNGLILVNVLWYLVAARGSFASFQKMSMYALINYGASLCVVEQPIRLLTSCFMHISWWHLAFNMSALAWLGYAIEGKIGHWRYILLYLFCGLTGAVASAAAFGGAGCAAGASGAIMGLGGFCVGLCYWRRDRYKSLVVRRIFQNFANIGMLCLILGMLCGEMMAGTTTDNAGHLGGFVGGLLAAWIFPRGDWRKRFIALATAAIASLGLWHIACEKYFEDGAHAVRAVYALSQHQNALAEKEFEAAIAFQKKHPTPPTQGERTAFAPLNHFLKSLIGSDKQAKMGEMFNDASWVESSQGHFARALELADTSMAYLDDAAIHDTRAMALMGLKNYAGARADLDLSLQKIPGYGAALFHLSLLNELDPSGAARAPLAVKPGQRFDYDPEEWENQFRNKPVSGQSQ